MRRRSRRSTATSASACRRRAKKALKAADRADREDIAEAKNAAKECASERETLGEDGFAEKYGTNHNKRNAFGKCVSDKTHDEGSDEQPEGS